ncbi:vacuolar segregation subunit 7-domain-containing protein [Boeremia exigua]|uniref:vacuolar segregation subunit 7-domain-containing protein n=1 Tax=Boeremia exigua TaxID=749465 RepID=UPI001E8DF6B3|nr:vacuolar segregation subunit 7-domain-containing protein [Boeremia exigua]KAH6644034.1 vacuolar segregation subunit 7-domain-containing protein [Boeremia exigua]
MTSPAAASLDAPFQSITGAEEVAEPASSSSTTPTPTTAASTRDSSTSSQASVVHAPPPGVQSSPATQLPSMRRQSLARDRSLNASASPSPANSALNSRDASPARSQRPSNPPPGPSARSQSQLRSRKSSADVSPSRAPATSSPGLSAAAIQRALSSASIPQLPPTVAADVARAPRPLKSPSAAVSGDSTPHWPVSPRIKSPPPPDARSHSRSRRNSLRTQAKKPDLASTPSIVVQHSSPSPAPVARVPVKEDVATPGEEDMPVMSMKAPSRGASGAAPKLETVQESSLPATPGFDGVEPHSFAPTATTSTASTTPRKADEDRNDVSSSKVTEDLSSRPIMYANTGSGSDSGTKNGGKGKMQEQRSSSTHRVSSHVSTKPSLTSLSSRARDPPLRNMTVETETVPSIAQATISNQDRSVSGRVDGSLRLKPSNETIRPKKERRPPKRKAPSIHSGTGRSSQLPYHYQIPSRPGMMSLRSYDDRRSIATMSPPASPEMTVSAYAPSFSYFYSNTNSTSRKASSKADVFEQKVASAVDEANSSDSDATFIYDRGGHHSRTPSMTSIASLADPRLAIRNEHKNPGKKSSMKFTNPYTNPNLDLDGLERGEGTIRLGSGRAGTGSHHHHIGRHGQGRGALGHILLSDDAASMSQGSRGRGPSSRHPSQPNSPRFHNFSIQNGIVASNHKYGELSTYDIDAGIVADDERTPLIPSARSPRIRTPRRRDSVTFSSLQRQLDRRQRNEGGWCRRFAGCLVLSILLLVVIFSSVGLVFATTKPLDNVNIRQIRNVVASQEELILDLVVDAINPNIIGVTITDMDVSIFAKSKHVGSDQWWHQHGNGPKHNNEEDWQNIDVDVAEASGKTRDGVDEGTDPIADPDVGEPRTMLLGRIDHFDSPLNFDGSYWHRHNATSVGEIRLTHPGSKTEAGGTERWEEVSKYPFQLLVRGNFKYQLPLSTRELKVIVGADYHYDPDAEKRRLTTSAAPPMSPGRYDRRTNPVTLYR